MIMVRRNLAWRPEPVKPAPPFVSKWMNWQPDYFCDLVAELRTDGGFLCVHQQPLELCKVCIMRMDCRYRRTENGSRLEG